jgi:oligopeptide/dipeptide ABC transporter ATP-binding protein
MEFPTSGKIEFAGRRGPREVQMIFQNAQASLDPRMMVGLQIREPLDIHGIGSAISRNAKTSEMLEAVGLPSALASRYPHELSGGQLQRVVIARALILEPRLLVADEPVSALDVSVQAQVVNLLADLQRRFGLTILFISHDLKIVRYISHEIAVMYLGKIVETGPSGQLLDRPLHPYTRALVSAVPVPVPGRRHDRIILRGEPPSPSAPPPGCRFHTRCPDALAICSRVAPPLLCHPEGRSVACHLHTEAGLAS